jgi:murein DD-endopeptidase
VISLNTPIICVEDGLIVDCGYNKSYGFFVVVHHGNATKNGYSSVYGHLNVIEVLMGQKVRKGQIIGLSGSTGRSTGPHLHFEWIKNQNSQRLNPLIPTSKKHSICKGLIGAFMKPIVELVDKVCAKIIVS